MPGTQPTNKNELHVRIANVELSIVILIYNEEDIAR
jgi:hypothetical protein